MKLLTPLPLKPGRRLLPGIIAVTFVISVLTVTALMEQPAKPGASETAVIGDKPAKVDSTVDKPSSDLAPYVISVGTYPFTNFSAVALEHMSSGTTQLVPSNQEDTASLVNNIGFDFWFDGARQTQFSANANGLMKLGGTAVTNLSGNNLTSTTNVPQIAPYWDDLFTGTNGKVHFKTVGSAPNRKLVVEWQNMQIPRVGSNNTGAGTFQCWLSETTGIIEFVYGSGVAVNSANSGYSVGFGSSGTAFASVTTSGPTVAYGAANNSQTNAITSGTKYTFTPVTPPDPSGLNFTAVTQTSMTLNWTDNSSNELGFAIFRSDDGGSTYSFVTQAAADATNSAQSPLLPGTTYFWKVFAVSEGALSANPAVGSNATSAAGNIISTTIGGDWSSTGTWVGGVVPGANDNVTIADGATVTINTTATCLNLMVGQGTSGILEYNNAPARTLTVNSDLTVTAGGTFTAGSGGLATHVLNIGGTFSSIAAGNLTVEGTLDLNTTAGVTTNFLGAANATISGSGPTCDFFAIVVNKGSNTTAILDVSRVITMNAPTSAATRLTVTSGTFKMSSASTITPYFGNQTISAIAGRLWINNSSASIQSVGAGVSGTGSGSPTITGTLQVDAGTFGYGQGNNAMSIQGSLIIGGANAAVNMFGRVFTGTAAIFIMTAGNFNVDPQNVTSPAANDVFNLSTGSVVNFTGGTLTIVDPGPNNATPADTEFEVAGATGVKNFAGSTIRFGDGSSSSSGNVSSGGFSISAQSNVTLGAIVVNNPTGTNRNVRISNTISSTCNVRVLTVTAGTFNLNGNTLAVTGDVTNDGVINGDSIGSVWSFIGTSQQNISGSGSYTNNRIRGLTINNTSGASPAVNLNQNVAVATALSLTSGSLGGIGTLTLGNAGGSAAMTTTRSGGSLINTPTFDLTGVTCNVAYNAPSPATGITTGAELPTSISGTLTINNSGGVVLNSPLTANTGLTLSNGLLTTTGTNLLTLGPAVTGANGSATSYVNGPLAFDVPTIATSRIYGIGKGASFRPLTLSSLALGVQSVVTAEVINGASGGTPVAPLSTLDPARYWQLSNSAALNSGARVRLAYEADDNVFDTATARVAQSNTSSGNYSSLGGSVTGTTAAGTIISTTNLAPGDDFFTIANESALPTAWDGGAATSNWGDAANWSNDTVPNSTTDISLTFGSPTTIDVNGAFSIKNLTVGANTTLNLGSGTLNVGGNYIQSNGSVNINSGNLNVTGASSLNGGSTNVNSGTYLSTGAFSLGGGTLANGSGTLNCKGNFTLTSGSFTVVSGIAGGTTIFSGTTTQTISGFAGGTSLNNLTLQGGGAGVPKNFTAGRTITAANDFIVATSAQISLSSAAATTFNVGGNLNYGGLTGGANIGSLILNLTGVNKTINGTNLSIAQRYRSVTDDSLVKTETVNMFTDPNKYAGLRKDRIKLESTYLKKRDEVNFLIAKKDPRTRLVINLDDATIVSNPTPSIILAPTPSAFEMSVTVASGASYSLLDSISIASARTLTITGRLNADNFTIGGAGNVTVTGSSVVVGNGTLGTATADAAGLAATLINTGINTFTDAIIEYNASGAQTINAANHPAAAMIYTAGSGTKTLNGNKTITGDSGDPLTKGALFVGSGTTFADGGFILSFTSAVGFANVIVNGTYLSTGAGGLSYESGPTLSSIQAVNGTQFGNLTINFLLSDEAILLNAPTALTTANISFRNLTFGGTAGIGVAGGTLQLNVLGTTNVSVNGNVNISPLTTSNTGGGFGGTSSTIGTVTVNGNITTTSTSATQPIFDSNGTNTLVMGNPSSLQTLTLGANATIFNGSRLQIDTPVGMQIGGTGRTVTLGSAGTMLVSAGASFLTGSNTFTNSGTTTVNGSFVISAGGNGSGGGGTYSYHTTTGTLVFNTTAISTVDASRTFWPAVNGPQNVSVIGAGGLTMSVVRTVGIVFQTTAGVSSANNLTFNGTCRINTGGSFTGAPTFGSNSVLIYNSGGTFGRGPEWSATSGAGFPNDVQISGNTTLNLGNGGAGTARSLARDLTIDSGSTFSMAITAMTAAVSVGRNVLNNGSLTLSSSNGGNMNVGGNWTNNSTFTSNGRTVTFNGASAQTIAGSTATVFGGLTISNSAGVSLGQNITVSGVLTLNNNLTTTVSFILTQSGTSSGTADVIGTVRRPDVGLTTRSFGNPNVQITNGGAATVDVNLALGSPGGFASAVQRGYSITPTGGTGAGATLRLHYQDSELGSNVETSLTLWREVSSTWTDQGFTSRDTTNNYVELTGLTGFSSWTLAAAPQAPTAVNLRGFSALENSGQVMLRWQSGYEAQNLGYTVYREQNGTRTAITPSLVAGSALIAGSNTPLTAGFSYTWYDQPPQGNGVATYLLEDVDINGTRTLHGPIAPLAQHTPLKGGARSALLGEVSRRTSGTGVQINRWPAALSEQQSRLRQPTVADPDALVRQRQVEALPGMKILVNRSGWYRITQPELVAAGLEPDTNAPQLQLFTNGGAVPIKQSGDEVHLTPSDYIEFYGEAAESTTDAYQTYYLVVNPEAFGSRIQNLTYRDPQPLPPPSGPTSFDYTVERRERIIYFSSLLNGELENFFGQIVSTTAAAATLPIANLDPASVTAGTPAQLEVSLQGVTAGSHLVQVVFNGVNLGNVNFTGTNHPVETFAVPATALVNGNNTLELTSLGGPADVSLIDTLRLTYAHAYAADNNALVIGIDNEETKRVTGFTNSNIRVVDVTDPHNVIERTDTVVISPEPGGLYSVDIQVLEASFRLAHTLIVFAGGTESSAAVVKHNYPSTWWSDTAGYDYVMIGTRELLASLEPLAQMRRNQGLVVNVVDVEDLYDEYSFGRHTPQAIRDYLESAGSWTRQPHFVLLGGDASYDPKNYFGQGNNDLVPTRLLDTALTETASDDWLADFNGDGIADLAMGRLPTRTPNETNALVGKILSYENATPDPSRPALLVADTGFEVPSTTVGNLMPATLPKQFINRSSADDATIHNQIMTSLNQGPLVANYMGHGSNGVWTGASLLSNDDAPFLTNTTRLSVFTMMTCYNGFFQDPYNESLSESLLKAPGGAVAVWASTTLTDPSGQNVIANEFYRLLFGPGELTVGDAARAAKAVTGDADVRRSWTLFGDPAMRLR